MCLNLTRRFVLTPSHADFMGRMRPSSMLSSMQDAATDHAELLGVGRAPLMAKQWIWILSRTHLQMRSYPVIGDQVTLTTWPGTPNRFFFPRYFTLTLDDGTVLGTAATLWLTLDLASRAVVPPSKCEFTFPDTSAIPAPLPLPERVSQMADAQHAADRSPAYTDLDINGHVNNTRYSDWICDALPLETLRTHAIENLLINYTKEVLPQNAVSLRVAIQDERFSVLGHAADGEQVYFEAGGTLMPWRS